MINWDKPIETIDGRKAKLLSCVMPVGGDYSSGRAVYVSPPPGAVFGDVFLVDEEGFRCDDSAPIPRPQIIRNARVKREGWVLVEPKKNRTLNDIVVAHLGTLYVYPTEKEALRAIEYHNMDLETKAVFFQWEE